ncbi:DUF4440 domain-containing protein [Thermobispora bispora]|uniref:nuclear transport factor 2 family protein n=1 Tax=Thermobispora bispora TaxID=2006 RepID=UPI001F59FF0D|nr:DUF4440 domain-containing protein [Thermobispora bispora]
MSVVSGSGLTVMVREPPGNRLIDMGGEHDDPVQAAITGEMRLLEWEVRSSAVLLGELLDPEFTEIGASGRLWDRHSLINALTQESDAPPYRITVSEMKGRLLAPGIVHLTYVSDENGRRARRSSIWRRSEQGWRLYFHQGTLLPPQEPMPADLG